MINNISKIQKSSVIASEAKQSREQCRNSWIATGFRPRNDDHHGNDTNKVGRMARSAGFVLFFSLLVSSIILAAGLAVSRIVVRQILLASIQKDSQMALFAADAGIECARYWKIAGFPNASTCNEKTISGQWLDWSPVAAPAISPKVAVMPIGVGSDPTAKYQGFWFNLGKPNITDQTKDIPETCVRIKFDKKSTNLVINAYGYNVPCSATGVPEGGRVVERGLRFTYQ